MTWQTVGNKFYQEDRKGKSPQERSTQTKLYNWCQMVEKQWKGR